MPAAKGKKAGKATKAAKVAPVPADDGSDSDQDSDVEHGEGPDLEFEDSDDSEDDGMGPNKKDDLEIKLDEVTETRAKNRAKKAKKKAGPGPTPTVVYIGHIPFGFFEKEMKGFFGQFGKVNRLRLSRSKKTTNSRGFGFIEFEHKEVAQIVADTMHNYLLYGRLLQCHIVAADKVHPDTFKNCDRRMKRVPRAKIAALKHNVRGSDAEKVTKLQKKLIAGENRKRKKLADLGIDYDYPGYDGAAPVAQKAKVAKVAKVAKANTGSKGKPAADKPAKKKQPVKAAAPVTPKAAVAGGSAKKVSKKKKKKKPVHMSAGQIAAMRTPKATPARGGK